MLEIKNITKTYNTKSLKQNALDDISINFRKSEFASILGPSGSGKTTFLNIVGGLDRYTKGDLIINEVSTKKYRDKDWDYYRNKKVGFVFQNYNLIMHQTILKNVELALTLSGTSKRKRIKKAKEALKKVGLLEHINKRPNELSGGQMQRVAIARSLVNDPEILLCDEPTGALDSKTSIDIMNILKEVSKDRLVIMVTHNKELAEKYSSRIINLKDGKIISDTNPYDGNINTITKKENKKSKRTSMSLLTAISLSLNNLMTKKARTFLTAFAGSIGIIGIALILSLSGGVKKYINDTQKEALSSYPITIEKTSFDIESVINNTNQSNNEIDCKNGMICTKDDITNNPKIKRELSYKENNLKEFKKYLEKNGGNINKYVSGVDYDYDINLNIYDGYDKITYNDKNEEEFSSMYESSSTFSKLSESSEVLKNKYKLLEGKIPSSYNEMVLIVDKDGKIPLSLIYDLNIEKKEDLERIKEDIKNNNSKIDLKNYDYKTFLDKEYKLVLSADYYRKQNDFWINKESDLNYMKGVIDNSLSLKIVGILKIDDEKLNSGYVAYDKSLINYIIDETNKRDIVKEQIKNKDVNVFTKDNFNDINTYDLNKKILGINEIDDPLRINIYPKDFNSKEKIEKIIDKYNKKQKASNKEENIISYTDMIGILISSVTSIVDIISYVLIAFVSVSLVVSSIMISIITYISVLERTKEIGILRSIGASKKDIRRVFNAETIIEGFISGLLGILIATIFTKPINVIIHELVGVNDLANLSYLSSLILILISVILTLIAGLIPSSKASKKDPVIALRSE